jgi:transposase
VGTGCSFCRVTHIPFKTLLSEFRTRLIESQQETVLLGRLLEACKQHGWLKAGGKQRTDSTHVLAWVRSLSNLECVGETLRAALDDLAALAPEWLVGQISPDWFERYSHRVESYRLPKAESQRSALAQQIGADGLHLPDALQQPEAPAQLSEVASVVLHKRVQAPPQALRSCAWRNEGRRAATARNLARSPRTAGSG